MENNLRRSLFYTFAAISIMYVLALNAGHIKKYTQNVFSRSNALRWNAYTSSRLSLNGSNETGYVMYEFPRRTVGTRESSR